MARKNPLRVLFSWQPNSDACVGTTSGDATIRGYRDRVDRTVMKAEHLLGRIR